MKRFQNIAAELAESAAVEGAIDAMLDAAKTGQTKAAQQIDREVAGVTPITSAKRRAIASKARAKLARRSLFHFFVQGWHALEPDVPLDVNWHHKLVCDVIQGILVDWLRKKRDRSFRQRVRSAIVNMPPGTTKSRIISVFAPAWMWLHCPSWSVLCLSANPDVATRDAGFCRDLVQSDWYRNTFNVTWTIREDIDAKGKFKNTEGGERTSRGLTSKIVGNRADAILIDDPNDMWEVFGEASRREVNGKFDNAIYNRVNDQRASVRILMQQRGHEDDLTGHWLRKSDGNVLHMCLPMEFDPARRFESVFGSDPRNDNGELLHAARFDAEFIAAERVRLGTFVYEAQYNQNAGNLDGGMFQRSWFGFFKMVGRPSQGFERPMGCSNDNDKSTKEVGVRDSVPITAHWTKRLAFDELYITVDATFGATNDSASEVGLQAVGKIGAALYVLDDRTDVMTYPQTKAAVRKMCEDYPAARRKLIEKKANGDAVIQELGNEIDGLIAVTPVGGKVARANALSARAESGNVYLLEGAPWLAKFVDQFGAFPNGKRDDRVDALSQVDTYINEKGSTSERWKALS